MTAPERYDAVAIAPHWSIALLILAAFGLGLTVDEFLKAWEAPLARAAAKIGHGGLSPRARRRSADDPCQRLVSAAAP